jgi:hypothetical protein
VTGIHQVRAAGLDGVADIARLAHDGLDQLLQRGQQ